MQAVLWSQHFSTCHGLCEDLAGRFFGPSCVGCKHKVKAISNFQLLQNHLQPVVHVREHAQATGVLTAPVTQGVKCRSSVGEQLTSFLSGKQVVQMLEGPFKVLVVGSHSGTFQRLCHHFAPPGLASLLCCTEGRAPL